MNEEYVVTEKAATASRIILLILLCWTIIYPLYFIVKLVQAKYTRYIFYQDRVVMKKGVIQKDSKTIVLTQIIGVSVDTTASGSIFGYGTVHINLVGKGDITLSNIKDPHGLCTYLESRIKPIDTKNQFITE